MEVRRYPVVVLHHNKCRAGLLLLRLKLLFFLLITTFDSDRYITIHGTGREVDRAKKLLHIRLERYNESAAVSGGEENGRAEPGSRGEGRPVGKLKNEQQSKRHQRQCSQHQNSWRQNSSSTDHGIQLPRHSGAGVPTARLPAPTPLQMPLPPS